MVSLSDSVLGEIFGFFSRLSKRIVGGLLEKPFPEVKDGYWHLFIVSSTTLFFIIPLLTLFGLIYKSVPGQTIVDSWSLSKLLFYPVVGGLASAIGMTLFTFLGSALYFRSIDYEIPVGLSFVIRESGAQLLLYPLFGLPIYVGISVVGGIVGLPLSYLGSLQYEQIVFASVNVAFVAAGYSSGYFGALNNEWNRARLAIQKQKRAKRRLNQGEDKADSGEFEEGREDLKAAKRFAESSESTLESFGIQQGDSVVESISETKSREISKIEQINTILENDSNREDKASLQSLIETINTSLQNAESSFQTAIAQHTQNNRTPAERDYRQAKEQYEEVLAAMDECDYDIFEHLDITVPVTTEAESLPNELTKWDYLSEDERDVLSDQGIETVSDIHTAEEELILELVEEDSIDEDVANRLRASKWWHGDGELTFTNRETIEKQRNCAERGQQMV